MSSPIGVFDSGVGGVSILNALTAAFPSENFIYIGDTARLPYGTKSPETVRKYTEQLLGALLEKNVKAFVIACNTASAQYFETSFQNIPIYNMIDCGAFEVLAKTPNKTCLVLATKGTIASSAYEKKILSLDPQFKITQLSCPLFVPFVEEGLFSSALTTQMIQESLKSLSPSQLEAFDSCILGCTHYPFLRPAISQALSSRIKILDCGSQLTELLRKDFASGKILRSPGGKGKVEILFTDGSVHFQELLRKLGREEIPQFIDLRN